MNYYLEVLKKYADFSGRARRKEYWLFMLFHFVIVLFLMIFVMTLGRVGILFGLIYAAYIFGTFIPSLAVVVRRLHDTNRSGWWYFISFVPFVGGVVLLVFTCLDGDKGANQFGADPKQETVK
ncbi:MAG: DUF805 domain-containing protein [bacterium]|nr:DUF805 domain-containing protein [bacterium]